MDALQYDFFLSHNRAEKAWVTRLAAALRKQGARVFFDEDSIALGQDIVAAIGHALSSSRYIVLILSKRSVQSRWVALEWASSLYEDVGSASSRLLPLVIEECEIPFVLRRLKHLDGRGTRPGQCAGKLLAHLKEHRADTAMPETIPATPCPLPTGLPAPCGTPQLRDVRFQPPDQDHVPQLAVPMHQAGAGAGGDQGPEAVLVLDTPPSPRHNLPRELTRFIGRTREITAVKHLLGTTPLVTLTGAGGTGKTRLALHVAADLGAAYADGVWLVELAALTDTALIPQTIAMALQVSEEMGRPLPQVLTNSLRTKALLLLLDSCEHLLPACARLVETLLRACPGLRVLATSRERLGIPGETTYRLPSLSLPDLQRLPPVERLSEYEAVALFVDRAVAIEPSFVLHDRNAPAVAQIAHRLDGIPLAIELAAAWVHKLPIAQIATRLDDRFHLLTGGSRRRCPGSRRCGH